MTWSTVFPELDDAVGWLLDVLIDGDAANLIGDDQAGGRVLDVGHLAFDVGAQRGIFKHAVAVLAERAVLNHQVVGIAQHLLSGDMAVHQTQVSRRWSRSPPPRRHPWCR